MPKQNLSSKAVISSIQATGKQYIVWDETESEFGLRVGGALKNGRPVLTWFVMRRLPGRKNPKKVTIGRYGHEWPPAKARQAAIKIKARMIDGRDPTVEKKAQATMPLFGEAAQSYIDRIEALVETGQRSPRTLFQYQQFLKGHLKRFKNFRLDEITHDDVRAFHSSMSDRPAMANSLIELMGAIYRPQKVSHDVRNPVEDFKSGGGKKFKIKRRQVEPPHYVLPRWLKGIEETVEARHHKVRDLFLFSIYSGLRRNESCTMRWSDVDEDAGTFTVRAKRNKQLTVHLTRQLREILARRREDTMEGCDWVFPSRTGNPRTNKLPSGPITSFRGRTDRYVEITESGGAKFYIHATRNTYLKVCRDLGFPKKMRKFLVGHEPGDETGDVTEDYEGDFLPEHVAAAAQVAADRIEAFMFERVAAEELKPTWLTAAEIETAAVNATNVYSGGRS